MADIDRKIILHSRYKFIVLGICIHALYLKSVFDVYFTSPLVPGLTPLTPTTDAPAKRLVLFIADGLRADKCFEMNSNSLKPRTPYLRSIIEKRGSWGVSHTRIPTETRPGHVAVIAGFYEDVSAVTRGWKENPVDFDSVFNESRWTFAWGSNDVVPIFTTGSKANHIATKVYDESMIDFADKDGSRLDDWVYKEVELFFKEVRRNVSLSKQLHDDKIIFFLHLLGLDVNGHGYRPNSDVYLNNVRLLDNGIAKMEKLIEEYYENDGKTAYIMTSDHGMSDWGSHGSGHPDETSTPLIAWGAGIRGPRKVIIDHTKNIDDVSKGWNLSHLMRLDVEQADLAPLMASLIGIPFPLNSVGVLPVKYLSSSDYFKAENLLRNTKQILSQYEKKEKIVEENAMFFKPFHLSASVREEMLHDIRSKITSGEYEEAMAMSRRLIEQILSGLRYYHSHNTAFIVIAVTIGFLGWILILVLEVFKNYTDLNLLGSTSRNKSSGIIFLRPRFLRAAFIVTSFILMTSLVYKRAVFMEYLYYLMPLVIWYEILSDHVVLCRLYQIAKNNVSFFKLITFVVAYGSLLWLLVASFTHRSLLSCVLVIIGIFPLYPRRLLTTYTILWFVICMVGSIFPLLPTIVREGNYALVAVAGFLTSTSSLIFTFFAPGKSKDSIVVIMLVVFTVLSTFLRLHTVKSIHAKSGLPYLNQLLSWSLTVVVPMCVLATEKQSTERLVATSTGLICIYILTCVSHEGLFVFVLAITMFTWMKCEQILSSNVSHKRNTLPNVLEARNGYSQNHRPLTAEDVRISFMFIFFILLAFFGTGNIASINSFDPAAMNNFITVFKPMLMASILCIKILIPFVIVACAFSAMQNLLKIEVRGLMYIVLIMTDLMSILFFFLVKNEGSWQDIGTSISHFFIMLVFIIFLVPLFELSNLITGSFTLDERKSHRS